MEEESSEAVRSRHPPPPPPPVRLMNFVSEDQLEEAKKARGERPEDGTAQRDRPLFEILRENKEKKDAEFNERFKHRPPKALDEDETEFLDKWEMSRKEYERQLANEEAEQLRSFQSAVAAQSALVHELKEPPSLPIVEEHKPTGKRHPSARSINVIIKVKPQAKKAKTNPVTAKEASVCAKELTHNTGKSLDMATTNEGNHNPTINTGLVSYSDESEEDD